MHIDRKKLEDSAGPLLVALVLMPAAVIVAFFPLNWLLGTVGFPTASIAMGYFRWVILVATLLGFAIAWRQRSRLLAVMLVPGILLALLGPDRIGSQPPYRGESKAFYPENYVPAAVDARIKSLEKSIANAGWVLAGLPLRSLSTERVRSFYTTANTSIDAWKGGVASVEKQRQMLQQQLNPIQQQRNALAGNNFARGLVAQLDAQINGLKSQLDKLTAAAAAGDLYPAAVSAAAALKVELEAAESEFAETISLAEALPYIFAASISFVIFICAVGFMNWALAALVLMTALACLWSAWPVSRDDWPVELPLILYPAFMCALSAFVLRFAYRAYSDNVLPQGVEYQNCCYVLRSAGRTFLLWLPFPLVIIGVVLVNNALYSYVSSAIYCTGAAKPFCGSLTSEWPIQDSDPRSDTLRDDVNAAVQRLFVKFEVEAVRSAQGAASGVNEQMLAAHQQVMSTFNRILPPNLYDIFPELKPPSDCDLLLLPDVKCFAKQFALNRLNNAYQGPRNRLKTRLETALTDVRIKVVNKVAAAATAFQDTIKGEAQQATLHATKTLDSTFVIFSALGAAQMALMLLVAMRAFLLILGRTLYNPPPSELARSTYAPYPPLALTHPEGRTPPKPKIAVDVYDGEFDLIDNPKASNLPLLMKRVPYVDGANQSTQLVRSRYSVWPFRRLRHGCLVLTEVTSAPGRNSIHFSTVGGRQLIVWTVPDGVEIFFRWDRFVAMSAGMRIKKSLSLRMGGLATGTTMQASVVGRGVLILEGDGKVGVASGGPVPGAVVPERWMSWVSGSAFRIQSTNHFTGVYVDPPHLEFKGRGSAVANAGGPPTRWGFGLATELIRLLRP